jgi:hypothetical protein
MFSGSDFLGGKLFSRDESSDTLDWSYADFRGLF